MIREEIGPESYWLGCIAPFQPVIGKVDAVRVSNDVGKRWSMETSGNMVKEMFADHYMNHVLWQNDPDVMYCRSYNMQLTREQKLLIAYYSGMIGGVVNTSDAFHKLTEEELKLWRFVQPGKEKAQAVLPYWGSAEKDVFVLVREYRGRGAWGVLIANISREVKSGSFRIKELTGNDTGFIFNWSPGKSSPAGQLDILEINLPGESCRLLYLSGSDRPPPANLALSGIEVEGLN